MLLELVISVVALHGEPSGPPPDDFPLRQTRILVRDPVRDPFCVDVKRRASKVRNIPPEGVVYGRSWDTDGKPLSVQVVACNGSDDCGPNSWLVDPWFSAEGFFLVPLGPVYNFIYAFQYGYEDAYVLLGSGDFCLEIFLKPKASRRDPERATLPRARVQTLGVPSPDAGTRLR